MAVDRDYSLAGPPRLSVVTLIRNEARSLSNVIARLPAGLHEVIVAGRRRIDGTLAVARSLRPDVRIVLVDATSPDPAEPLLSARAEQPPSAGPARIPQS